MAQTLKIKRGNNANLAGLTLAAGEPAFALDTGKLYVGDGTNKVLINPDAPANAATATKLQTARTIGLSGDASGSTSFDGSANATITVVLANSGATAGTYTKLTVDAKGRVTSAAQVTAADIPTLTLAKISDAGTAASKNTGTASGNVPVLDGNGKLDASVLPAIAITDTFVVASQTAMLALTAEIGDVAVRTDLNKSFILRVAGASTLANWQELLSPTDAVQSVAGKTGVVVLTATDISSGTFDPARLPAATTSAQGALSAADKTKLDGIAAGANNYVHPAGDGNQHVPATGTTNNGKVLKAGATAGSAAWGVVDWGEVSGKPAAFTPSAHTHDASEVTAGTLAAARLPAATTSTQGAMSAADKTKLDGIAAGAQVNTVSSVAGKTGAVALVKGDVGLGNVQNYGISSKVDAEDGVSDIVYMTPLRTAQAIAASVIDGGTF